MTSAITERLISDSITTDSITRAPWSAELAAELSALSSDLAEPGDSEFGELEFWGEDDDGAEWRVHLTGPRKIFQLYVTDGTQHMSPAGLAADDCIFATRDEAEWAREQIATDRADGDAELKTQILAELCIREIDA